MTTANPDLIPMQVVPTPADWFGVLRQYGLATALTVVAVAYFGFLYESMRRNQQAFMDSVIETNKVNAATMAKQSEIQQQQAKALTDLVPLLQQIRDDQRRGAWLEHKPAGAGT